MLICFENYRVGNVAFRLCTNFFSRSCVFSKSPIPRSRGGGGVAEFLCNVIAGVFFQQDFGGVLERYWVNSAGFAVLVPNENPLSVGFKNGSLVFIAKSCPEFPVEKEVRLDVHVFSSESLRLKDLHLSVMKRRFGIPNRVPNPVIFKNPIWSTWAFMGKDINQEKILDFVHKIIDNRLPIGVLGIDDMWSKNYGDFSLDTNKFGEDPVSFIRKIKNLAKCDVIVWVHPFVDAESESFDFNHVFNEKVKWWNGESYVWDFSSPEVSDFFRSKLEGMKSKYGIDGFKFDAGEFNYSPADQKPAGYPNF